MDLEQTFAALDAAGVAAFVTEGQEEHLQLDFKLVSRPDLSHDDDKRNFARALSGLANSSGGLVVWGVNARKNAAGVDAAESVRPIPDVARLVSRLNALTGEYVTPVVDGVRHRAIPGAGDGAGYVVTLVPPSDAGPHMAKAGEHRYYKRSGDSFYRMEHFDLEDMFGRRRRPKLGLDCRVMLDVSDGTTYRGKAVLRLTNTGRGVARAPYLEIRVAPPYRVDRFGVDGNGREGLPRLVHAGPPSVARYGADAAAVVHAGVDLDVTAVDVTTRVGVDYPVLLPPPVRIAYTVAAEGVPPTSGALEVSSDERARALLPPALYPPEQGGV